MSPLLLLQQSLVLALHNRAALPSSDPSLAPAAMYMATLQIHFRAKFVQIVGALSTNLSISQATTFLMLRSVTSSLLRIASRPSASMLLHRHKSTGQVGVLSGAPKDELERKVFIYRPAKSAGQHASAAVPSYSWKLSFEKKDRWVNPLMGWTSSSDSLAGQTPGNMNFESKDAAIAFAEKNGEFNAFHVTKLTILATYFYLIIF